MVFAVFPIFMASVMVLRGVVLFKRGLILDKEVRRPGRWAHALPAPNGAGRAAAGLVGPACLVPRALMGSMSHEGGALLPAQKFNAWLDRKMATSPIPGLLVYPEGSSSTSSNASSITSCVYGLPHPAQPAYVGG